MTTLACGRPKLYLIWALRSCLRLLDYIELLPREGLSELAFVGAQGLVAPYQTGNLNFIVSQRVRYSLEPVFEHLDS